MQKKNEVRSLSPVEASTTTVGLLPTPFDVDTFDNPINPGLDILLSIFL